MYRSELQFAASQRTEQIARELEKRQYLQPHQPLKAALDDVRATAGFCPLAGEQAVKSLQLDGERKIGRFKRSELAQLARAIFRIWRQSLQTPSEVQAV